MNMIYGSGNPIIKVTDINGTVTKSFTLQSEVVEKNFIAFEENSIQFTNVLKEAKKRKSIQRVTGEFSVVMATTATIDNIMFAWQSDGVYGTDIELQPFSDNSALKLKVHFTEPVYPVNDGGTLVGHRRITVKWRAEASGTDYATIRKYS